MDITLKQLKVFLAVAQSNNLTAAAAQLFMTKGAVSQTLSELEKRLGQPLFDRHHARIFINHDGEKLIPVADELLSRMNEISALFSHSAQEPTLLLGCSKTIGSYILPGLLGEFKNTHQWLPKITIENTNDIIKKLLNFDVDLAIIEGAINDNDISSTPWLTDEMVIIAAKNHPLALEKKVPFSVLSQQSWILREQGSGSRSYFENNLAPLLTSKNVILALDTFDSILFSVQQNLGITYASRLIIQNPFFQPYFSIIKTEKRFFRSISLCHHRQKYLSAGARLWIDFLNQAGQTLESARNSEIEV
ncbi:LysR substrate-binding domain-containing protein [Yersinia ruckeri]|uniref:LysR substrate-binding domain-containing protein n=1 Tax=Yersinia ruckeri TaxID=29486 RepID=UPI0005EA9112|nr:LysR substrate-binding domain-containing protein [Yersinia ruckeri]AKA38686.1 LysR family transcriptional regulator [Yersinia ruckeri]EKN4183721.1 LysR family transcriptional regulator [Yersinia ruckeri]EKN4692745.1 LysR family transcriptional regulator [Yersinia ruckeri]MCK8556299.1 LysR family transcriptional regulator [Yersinia ruckeri]MCW6650017.1 LysR substrate-binding domain-containing protein [Yersinia ruckeri]